MVERTYYGGSPYVSELNCLTRQKEFRDARTNGLHAEAAPSPQMGIGSQDRDGDQSGKSSAGRTTGSRMRKAKARSKGKAVRKSKVMHRSGRKKLMGSV
jgi:hypothetical protein